MKRTLRAAIGIVAFFAPVLACEDDSTGGSGDPPAFTLITDESGQLIGAHGVIVSGELYDVEFLAGSCAEVFSGCDELTDITFLRDEAVTAAQALLDQVFVRQFDSDPELTRGCTSTETCRVQIPRWINEDGSAPVAIAINGCEITDPAGSQSIPPKEWGRSAATSKHWHSMLCDYNVSRPYQALHDKTPTEFVIEARKMEPTLRSETAGDQPLRWPGKPKRFTAPPPHLHPKT